MAEDKPHALHVPAREIPVPAHLSPQAQAWLSMVPPSQTSAYPALDDAEAWRQRIAVSDAMIMQMYIGGRSPAGLAIEAVDIDGVACFSLVPEGVTEADRRVYLDIHGGALIMGAGEVCKAMAMGSAANLGTRVVAVDYRMPPDYPYPASLDDCLTVYRALLRDYEPKDIIVGGGSAGGNLAAALLLRARDEGLPLPAAAALGSPEVDLTESGDSFNTNAGIDGMGSLMQANLLYAGDADLTDPYISPLFGDFTQGFPPTMLSAGTRDVFLSNAVRMHRALRDAGIEAELHILEAAAHGAFGGSTPEEASLDRETKRFCEKWWARG